MVDSYSINNVKMENFCGRLLIMKMRLILGAMTIIPVAAFAHAGMFDRYLEKLVNIGSVVLTVIFMQVLCFLILRFCRCKLIASLRARLLLISKRLCRNWWLNILSAWMLSTFVLSTYLTIMVEWLIFLGLLLYLIFWICYCFIVFRKRIREKWMTGLRPIYYYIVASIGQFIGLITYSIVYSTDWFRSITYYTDEEYASNGYRLFPEISGLEYLVIDAAVLALPLAVPVLIIIAIRLFGKSIS